MSAETTQGKARSSRRTGVLLAAAMLAAALVTSPSLHRYQPTRMTYDETMYGWKAQRIAQQPSRVFDHESWRRHPPAVPALIALFARAMPIEDAMSLTAKLSLVAALLGIGAFAFRLAGPIAGGTALVLLALHDGVREYAAHTLLDLPLVAALGAAAALFTLEGRARWLAFAVAALAAGIKSYGVLVLAVLLIALLWERLSRGWRIAIAVGLTFGAGLLLGVGQLGWMRERFYWLAPHDPLRTGADKLYHVVQAFQWLWPAARARTLAIALAPVVLGCALFARPARARDRILLAASILVPLGPLVATRIVERRTLLLLEVPLFVWIGTGLACAVARVPSARVRTALSASLLACGVGLLAITERTRASADPCRFAGQFETAVWLHSALPADARLYSTSTHPHRFYGGLEFEKDGGPLYGENEWTGVPFERERFVREIETHEGESWLAIGWNQDTMPRWLRYEPEVAAQLRGLGFVAKHETWLPANAACEPADPNVAAREDAFFSALGSARRRAGGSGPEYLAALVLARPRGVEAGRSADSARELPAR